MFFNHGWIILHEVCFRHFVLIKNVSHHWLWYTVSYSFLSTIINSEGTICQVSGNISLTWDQILIVSCPPRISSKGMCENNQSEELRNSFSEEPYSATSGLGMTTWSTSRSDNKKQTTNEKSRGWNPINERLKSNPAYTKGPFLFFFFCSLCMSSEKYVCAHFCSFVIVGFRLVGKWG